jgi:large subunit ribosomal protein L6
LIANMVIGVTEGYRRGLELVGVGYRASMSGRTLVLNVGFSHPVEIEPPEGVTIETPTPTTIVVRGIDKEAVGVVAARIRSVRPPEPYQGKGIRYAGEKVRRKAGKAGK